MTDIGDRPALLLVDPQRKFSRIREDWKEAMEAGVEGMNRFISVFRRAGAPIVFMRYVGPSHLTYDGDDGDEWLEGIDFRSDLVLDKGYMNSFRETCLAEKLSEMGVDSLVIAGMVTQACVMSTYYAAFDHGFLPHLAKGALISTEDRINDAPEVLCGAVDLQSVERALTRHGQVRVDIGSGLGNSTFSEFLCNRHLHPRLSWQG